MCLNTIKINPFDFNISIFLSFFQATKWITDIMHKLCLRLRNFKKKTTLIFVSTSTKWKSSYKKIKKFPWAQTYLKKKEMYTNVFETFFHLNEISVCKDAFVVDLYFREHILCFVFLYIFLVLKYHTMYNA